MNRMVGFLDLGVLEMLTEVFVYEVTDEASYPEEECWSGVVVGVESLLDSVVAIDG